MSDAATMVEVLRGMLADAAARIAAARDGKRGPQAFFVGFAVSGNGIVAVLLRQPQGGQPGVRDDWEQRARTPPARDQGSAARVLLESLLDEAETDAAAAEEGAARMQAQADASRRLAASIRAEASLARFLLERAKTTMDGVAQQSAEDDR